MPEIRASIACNLNPNMLSAALPLLAAEEVEGMEWSFDTLLRTRNIPPWFTELLVAFGKENRLVGHGVYFSLFSGKWLPEQQKWLDSLKKKCAYFNFDHVTEHFGFMTGKNFHQGAPISIPFTPETLAIGQDRLKRISNTCERPVGLENLAFAYSLEEVKRHGDFLEKLIAPVNGFIILDLHNLYCHLHNFDCDFPDIIKLYPLDRVREIHISGGSWENSTVDTSRKVRRDTHDSAVPAEVFELLEKVIPLCPNLKFSVLEQVGTGLKTEESKADFRSDFLKMKKIIKGSEKQEGRNDFCPPQKFELSAPVSDENLYQQQKQLTHILENAKDCYEARKLLQNSTLAGTAWQTEKWDSVMLETVVAIAQKWK